MNVCVSCGSKRGQTKPNLLKTVIVFLFRSRVMSLIDSEKAFQKRCEEMHDGLFEKLQGQNIGSFSTLAFALGSPQNPVSDDEFTKLADAVFETQSTLGTTAILRRLHFESCTLLIAEMKTQSACADASEPIRKLPFIEKQSRLDAQKKSPYRHIRDGTSCAEPETPGHP